MVKFTAIANRRSSRSYKEKKNSYTELEVIRLELSLTYQRMNGEIAATNWGDFE